MRFIKAEKKEFSYKIDCLYFLSIIQNLKTFIWALQKESVFFLVISKKKTSVFAFAFDKCDQLVIL